MPAHRRTADHPASDQLVDIPGPVPPTRPRPPVEPNPHPITQPAAHPANAQASDWGTEPLDPSTYDPISRLNWAKDSTLVVVDLRHLGYRGFYSIDPPPTDLRQKSLTLRVMLDSLAALADAARTSRFLLVGDGGLAYKRKVHPGYKDRQDKKDDPEQAKRSELFRFHYDAAVTFFKDNGIPTLHLPDLEADDAAGLVVGLLAYPPPNGVFDNSIKRVLLVSDDKDWYQLLRKPGEPMPGVSPEVLIWRGVRKEIVDTANFVSRHGFTPDRYPDYKALVGESKTGDNIPGVPGVGDVTAGRMVGAARSLGGIIDACKAARAAGSAKKVEGAVVDHEADARLSLRLSTITTGIGHLAAWGFDSNAITSMLSTARAATTNALRGTQRVKFDLSLLAADGVDPARAVAGLRAIGGKG